MQQLSLADVGGPEVTEFLERVARRATLQPWNYSYDPEEVST